MLEIIFQPKVCNPKLTLVVHGYEFVQVVNGLLCWDAVVGRGRFHPWPVRLPHVSSVRGEFLGRGSRYSHAASRLFLLFFSHSSRGFIVVLKFPKASNKSMASFWIKNFHLNEDFVWFPKQPVLWLKYAPSPFFIESKRNQPSWQAKTSVKEGR